jgi:hypothetical protein
VSGVAPPHNSRKLLRDGCGATKAAGTCPSAPGQCGCDALARCAPGSVPAGVLQGATHQARQLHETKVASSNTPGSVTATVAGQVIVEDQTAAVVAAVGSSPASIPTWQEDLTAGSGVQRLDASGAVVLKTNDLPPDFVVPKWKQQQPQQEQQPHPASNVDPPLIIGVALGGCILLCAVWLVVGNTRQADAAGPPVNSWRGPRNTLEEEGGCDRGAGQLGGEKYAWTGGSKPRY